MLPRSWFLLLLVACLYSVEALPISGLTSSSDVNVLLGDSIAPSSGSSRTIYSIVRSCLLTILACVYRAIHPNIPSPTARPRDIIKEHLILMGYMLLAPELIIYWASEQWYGAREIAYQLNETILARLAENERDDWKTHHRWTTVHGHFIQMGGFVGDDGCVLTSDEIARLIRHFPAPFNITSLDPYSEKHIKDKSKGDIISKVVLTIQTSWFVFQCLARVAQHLELAELEVVTFAYSILNIVTFLLWYRKPLNVHCAIHFKPPTTLSSPSTVSTTPEKSPGGSGSPLLDNLFTLFHPFVRFFSHLGQLAGFTPAAYELEGDRYQVGRFYRERPDENAVWLYLGTAVLGVAFGATHFMSWSFSFPTDHERVLWRVFTIVATTFPFAFVALGFAIYEIVSGKDEGCFWNVVKPIVIIVLVSSTLFYACARLGLVIQALVALRKLPPGVFENITWNSFWPHF